MMVSKIGWIQLFRNSGADVPPGIAQRVVAVRTGDASIRSPAAQVAEDKQLSLASSVGQQICSIPVVCARRAAGNIAGVKQAIFEVFLALVLPAFCGGLLQLVASRNVV